MRRRFRPAYLLVIPLLCLGAVIVYNIPFVHERLAWRVDNLRVRIQYALNPPEQVVFVPEEAVDAIVNATLTALAPTATTTPTPTPTETRQGPTETPRPSDTPEPSDTAPPPPENTPTETQPPSVPPTDTLLTTSPAPDETLTMRLRKTRQPLVPPFPPPGPP